MKANLLGLLISLASSAIAQDLLFHEDLLFDEYDEALALGYTTKVATAKEWEAFTTEDFAKFKAIIVPDPSCGLLSSIQFLEESKDKWSPAATGNHIYIGTDPSFHFSQGKAKTLIDNSIKFAAAGTTPAGVPQTGLYFALSCYYNRVESAKVEVLSHFGDFTVRGNLNCYNKVHLVASSDAMDSLDDASLSDWSCSVHEAFASYPSVGKNGFQALAIAQDILGVGSQTFGDGTMGLPYIISRGATPAKCGDGTWDKDFGEECDDGNTLNGDGCSLSCKCESGKANEDGTCAPGNVTSPADPTGKPPVFSTGIIPTGVPPVYPTGVYPTGKPPVYSTGVYPTGEPPVYSSGHPPVYPSGETPIYPTDEPPVYPTGSASVYPTGKPPAYPPGETPAYPSGETPGYSPVYPPGVYPSNPYGNSSVTPKYPVYPPGSHPTTTYSPPPYVTPSCPTGPKIIGVEYIVEVTYKSDLYVPCSTSIRPIYDASTSVLPCYACAMSSEHITYTSTDFVTVSTTTCKTPELTHTYEPKPPVIKPCEKCAEYTVTETECIGGPHTEYTPIEYVPETAHVHISQPAEKTYPYTAPAYTPAPSGPGKLEYVTSLATYPLPSGTGRYYPTPTSGVLEFTGAAVAKEMKAAGVVGGALLALAGML